MMDNEQYEARFGEVYRGIREDGSFDSLIIMVLGYIPGIEQRMVTTRWPRPADYKCIYLTGPPEETLVNWGLYKHQWKRIDHD